jgi:hypothetical protein
VYPRDALMPAQAPTFLAFVAQMYANMFIPGRNQGGLQTGQTRASCAQLCLAMAACRSFEYGLEGTLVAGYCYLSFDTRLSPGALFLNSTTYDYYERI